ncbi:DUF4230 domain-containing protein [Sphingomonas sp.]|uniref:DUF4230 domain-containing protein n=1 Tax=Sphingomonas sp. TaxID=28214 RepID=UPI0025F9C6B3|nr:DUF4230 domain-containing protein [Sphingomonas sp.]
MSKGCMGLVGTLLALILVIGGGFWFLGDQLKRQFAAPSPVTVAQASLQGLREQNRLSTFAARYVAVVTSTQSRLGLEAKKTMIMPGNVRYEVDLSKLQQRNLSWDAANNKLTITLPPIEVVGPEVDINNIREYGAGGLLMSLTNAEDALDEANRKAAQVELVRQAREETPMRLARDATRRAVERSFSMPLRAIGVNANVEVLFPDETNAPSEQWDVSRSVSDVLANRN